MYKNLKFDIKKYPKGDSQKYDTNYKPSEQKNLFIWYTLKTYIKW